MDTVLGALIVNLSSLFQGELGLLWGVEKDMEKLSSKLSAIRAVLEDAELKQVTDKAIANWLRKLKDTVYKADSILDEWSTEVRRSELDITNSSCTKQVIGSSLSFLDFKQIVFRDKIGKQLQEILEEFDEIAEEKLKFHLRDGVTERGVLFDRDRETSSVIAERQIYGREEDRENIVKLLIDNTSSQNDISVCPIIGIGGLGKTTLAQLVYNDERVSKHFEERIWVCVAEDFDVKRLIRLIIESLSGEACDLEGLDLMQSQVSQLLDGKRFLLVLDDVWSEDQDKWDKVRCSLTCGAKGSSVLVTTRLQTVALVLGTVPVYNLTTLSEDECWSLFRGRAFGREDEESNASLVEIGKQIVKKCGGMPLVAKVLGALMRFKREVREWSSVRDSEIWELPEEEGGAILGVLRLSYDHLPPYLRQCFSYCSVFPKNFEMEKEDLIQLWIANGFVQLDGRTELEDVGNKIFNELLRRSFFQDLQRDNFGNIKTCKMHDHMHDLACSLAVNECFAMKVDETVTVPKSIQHLSLIFKSWKPSKFFESLYKPNQFLRTHLLLGSYRHVLPLHIIFTMLKCLRALNLTGIRIKHMPVSIGSLRCLRYLNLSKTSLRFLPGSICRLINLQTLKLVGCYKLQVLPKYMRNLKNLRHLDIHGCKNLSLMPVEIGQLTCLHTLGIFIVGQKVGQQIKELEGLSHLGGELHLKGLQHVRDSTEAKEANLVGKQNLSSLQLSWKFSGDNGDLQEENVERVLEGLEPHPNLKRLVLEGFSGFVFASWMKFLPGLFELELKGCIRCENLPPLGQLPLLKVLYINGMDSLKCIRNDFYGEGSVKGFPSLERLYLKKLCSLEEWYPSNENEREWLFPRLESMIIKDCPKLESFPFLPCVKHLALRSCKETIVRSLRSLPSLSSLVIYLIAELTFFPKGSLCNLTALKSLNIVRCRKLKSIPEEIENLTELTSLKLTDCQDLVSLPEGLQKLTSLTSFTIKSCKSLKSLPAMGIQGTKSSLCLLQIFRCDNLTSLSEGLQYLSSLELFVILGCSELELSKEDFQYLISLQTLRLKELPKLTSFPDIQNLNLLGDLEISKCENLRIFPQGLQCLTSIQSLRIEYVHRDLHAQIEKEKGKDWAKVSHIPNLFVRP